MAITFCVTGDPMRAAMIGAAIARYCGGQNCAIVPRPHSGEPETVLMRTDHLRFHAELQIDPAQVEQLADARRIYAYHAVARKDAPLIPFSPFGFTAQGVEFHQLWLRAYQIKTQPPLEAFSAAIALAAQGAAEPQRQMDLAYGIECSRRSYAQFLLEHARRLGASVGDDNAQPQHDLLIDCGNTNQDGAIVWDADQITISPRSVLAGEEWQAVVNAARRIVAMAAKPSDAQAEQREFNRLSAASEERMADFRALLTETDLRAAARPALQRKIEVFEACGRIPTEDYEVFASFEWLAALWACGIRPKRHERLADRMPKADLMALMNKAYAQAQSVVLRGAAV